jgi:hypothetical protein
LTDYFAPRHDAEETGKSLKRRIDLLTVLMHELGRVLGSEHDDAIEDDLMDDLLGVGQRRLPTAQDVDAMFAAGSH